MNPHPCGHIIYPYTDEGLVGQAVTLFASAGLRDREGVILIMSKEHSESFKVRLSIEGLNPEKYERTGQLTCVTAEETLSRFMPDGVIDEDLFKSIIGDLIAKARASVGNESGRVRLFGEMVSQLRREDLTATTRLEELWNAAVAEHSVALLCTYALDGSDDRIEDELIRAHTESIQRESATAGAAG